MMLLLLSISFQNTASPEFIYLHEPYVRTVTGYCRYQDCIGSLNENGKFDPDTSQLEMILFNENHSTRKRFNSSRPNMLFFFLIMTRKRSMILITDDWYLIFTIFTMTELRDLYLKKMELLLTLRTTSTVLMEGVSITCQVDLSPRTVKMPRGATNTIGILPSAKMNSLWAQSNAIFCSLDYLSRVTLGVYCSTT